MSRAYNDHKIYCCFTLNRLVAELGIDLYQQDLESKLDRILVENTGGISKEEVKYEIRSNHFMTNKVIEKLVENGQVRSIIILGFHLSGGREHYARPFTGHIGHEHRYGPFGADDRDHHNSYRRGHVHRPGLAGRDNTLPP